MASDTEIGNLALQKLGGSRRITDLGEDTVAARAINVCFGAMRDATLRDHGWTFARRRASLPELVDGPAWGDERAYQLPPDFLRFDDFDRAVPWSIEGSAVLARTGGGPLAIRYIARVANTGAFDALFVDALAWRIAHQVSRPLTGSTVIAQDMWTGYREALATARRVNGRETMPDALSESDWLLSRERRG